ncbi:MAG TPA: hypothetical protein VEO00_10480, partial [Actinomycetota bacterium]|nr:hypothetical protein [Actinomycetota bacterium]
MIQDARSCNGDHTFRFIDTVSQGNHEFLSSQYNNGWFHYAIDGNYYDQPYVRTPNWVAGHPNAGGEIRYSCDQDTTRWWGLKMREPIAAGGDWVTW